MLGIFNSGVINSPVTLSQLRSSRTLREAEAKVSSVVIGQSLDSGPNLAMVGRQPCFKSQRMPRETSSVGNDEPIISSMPGMARSAHACSV